MRPTAVSVLLGCANAAIIAVVLITIDRVTGSLALDALATAGLALLLTPLNAAFWRTQQRGRAPSRTSRPGNRTVAADPEPVARER